MSGALILAAGNSSRLGEPKQLILFQGETLLAHTVRMAMEVGCEPIIAVLGASAEECAEVLKNQPVELVFNDDWREGVASSIRAGVARLENADGTLILLCDQPQISPQLLSALVTTGSPLAASSYNETAGPPAYFDRRFFPELLALRGDNGAKVLFQKYAGEMVLVPFPEGVCDIDTPADREKFLL